MVNATLLIVDDEQMLLEMMTKRFKRLSYSVFSAASGAEALAILHSSTIDVLITDFNMPSMNGAELIKQAIHIDPMLQSIVVTGYGDLTTAVDVMGAGAFNYLEKPVDFTELQTIIQKCLEKRKQLQEKQDKQQQLRAYREQLEELVKERTVALTQTNHMLELELEQRKRLEHSLREAKIIAENASKAKSEFLANMSHEIRTPMTSAIGLLNLVLDTELEPKQKTYLEMVRVSTMAMHNLLNDILDFSKIEAGKLNLESISFDPRKVIHSVIDLQHFLAEEKGIKLSSIVASDVPDMVVGDPNRLQQILLNLVSNGLKFTQYGEVVIQCKRERVATDGPFSSDKNSTVLHFSVQDTGTGIEKDKKKLIFEAFTQADSSTTRKFGGVGLGLNICSKLITMMGGHISVESEGKNGSTFYFTCTFGVVADLKKRNKGHAIQKISCAVESTNQKAATILLVEDNPSNQWVFRELLQKHGYTVVNVADGASALQEMESRYFDLMLLDLQLPQMNGYEVVRQIRKKENQAREGQGQSLPIVAMTGLVGENEKQKCLAAGMDGFIAKPFTVDQLIGITRKALDERSIPRTDQPKIHKGTRSCAPVLKREIFNEDDALKKAIGNRDTMCQRIQTVLETKPHQLTQLRNAFMEQDKKLLEQVVCELKEGALEVGAITLADELFSLLMKLRNNQTINESEVDIVAAEFEYFAHEIKTQAVLGEK